MNCFNRYLIVAVIVPLIVLQLFVLSCFLFLVFDISLLVKQNEQQIAFFRGFNHCISHLRAAKTITTITTTTTTTTTTTNNNNNNNNRFLITTNSANLCRTTTSYYTYSYLSFTPRAKPFPPNYSTDLGVPLINVYRH